MSGDIMEFPETVEEFMEEYKMVDKHEIYSNGTEYVPIFRMEQWFEHCKIRSANAKRHIDADALLNTLFEVHCKECDKRKGKKNGKYKTIYEVGEAPCKSCGVNDMREYIEDAPTADVREVVHGEWIDKGEDYMIRWTCSNCGRRDTHIYDFCPDCGADMRERREDDKE